MPSKYEHMDPRNVPLLFSHMIVAQDNEALKGLLKATSRKLNLEILVKMLKVCNGFGQDNATFAAVKCHIVNLMAVSVSQGTAPPDLQVLAEAAKTVALAAISEEKKLKFLLGLAASPALLGYVHNIALDSPWKQAHAHISDVLEPFVKARVEVPRLEASVAVCLLGFLHRVRELPDVCGFAALVLPFRAHSLISLSLIHI